MFYSCISAQAYYIIDADDSCRIYMVQDGRLSAWSNMELQQVQCDFPLPSPLVLPQSADPVGLTCWVVIIKSGCPTQERENLTNPTQHNSACKRIRVKRWAETKTRFKSYTLAHSWSAIIIIIIIVLYPEINQNKDLLRVAKQA